MLKSISFEVIGEQRLHCEACEQRIERLLKALQGVAQVRAEAPNQRIEVLFDAAVLDAATITERLSKAGYETRVRSATSNSGKGEDITESGLLADIELHVLNMVCEGCAEKIGDALKSVPGVRKVKSKVRQKQVYIQYEPNRVQKEQLEDALEEIGYTTVEASRS